MHFQAFVEAHLPPAPGRVLEVGCGRGRLARAVAELGYRVTAIDPEAPAGAIFQPVSLEEFSDPGPFDAVLANLALHHIPDLRAALVKIERLLRPGGRLIVNEPARVADHAGLHSSAAMRSELDLRFEERFFAWMPIQATGFRYVGERRTGWDQATPLT